MTTQAAAQWKRGEHYQSIVSDSPVDGGLGNNNCGFAAYGGYLVAESVAESVVPLFLAAPDAIAVCQAVAGLFATESESNLRHGLGQTMAGIVIAARATIAKALGHDNQEIENV